ncbi:hypothetical protein ET464_12610 [Paenibacillus protaetiae]|uniref:Uncharacterized protein n=1 Tax=Paenibacillus protaetiae TaxID=2509456 RepID=A0A4P6EVT3_9BACL|nr:hypothetical protein ET464_12610 [Paenibacillus protaetiae]
MPDGCHTAVPDGCHTAVPDGCHTAVQRNACAEPSATITAPPKRPFLRQRHALWRLCPT